MYIFDDGRFKTKGVGLASTNRSGFVCGILYPVKLGKKEKNTFNKPEEHLMWVPRRSWQKCDRRRPTVHLDVPSEQNRNLYLNLHLMFEVLNMQQGLMIY